MAFRIGLLVALSIFIWGLIWLFLISVGLPAWLGLVFFVVTSVLSFLAGATYYVQ